MNISVKLEGFDGLQAMLNPKVYKAAAYRAINLTVDGAVTDASSEIRDVYRVNKADLDKRFKRKYCPDYDTLTGSVEIGGEEKQAIPLIMFSAKGRVNMATGSVVTRKGKHGFISLKQKRRGTAGVGWQVLKSGGKGFSDKAWIMTGGGGSLQVVRRIGKGKHGLKEMRVITPATMLASGKHGVRQRMQAAVEKRLAVNFERQLRYYQAEAARGNIIGGTWDDVRRKYGNIGGR